MRALIDTNVALTYVSGREDKFSEQSDKIMLMCAEEKVDGYLAYHSLSTIWYVTVVSTQARTNLVLACFLLKIRADRDARNSDFLAHKTGNVPARCHLPQYST